MASGASAGGLTLADPTDKTAQRFRLSRPDEELPLSPSGPSYGAAPPPVSADDQGAQAPRGVRAGRESHSHPSNINSTMVKVKRFTEHGFEQ